jgi:hypothetical protein
MLNPIFDWGQCFSQIATSVRDSGIISKNPACDNSQKFAANYSKFVKQLSKEEKAEYGELKL